MGLDGIKAENLAHNYQSVYNGRRRCWNIDMSENRDVIIAADPGLA